MLHHSNRAALFSAKDLVFPKVVTLLHGDGTNGGQNNTFIDGSANNYSVTRVGNTTQGTFSPYGTLWSNYFDGTGDYLQVADNVGLRLGTGAFTVEAWIYVYGLSTALSIAAKGTGTTAGWVFQRSSANVIRWVDVSGVNNIDSASMTVTNDWVHIAIVREGTGTNQTKIYVDGKLSGQGTIATDYSGTEPLYIGVNRSVTNPMNGYISNLRIVKGTAVYTSDFSLPTARLTAIANTQLLTCQSNSLIDNSSNKFSITHFGDTRVQRFSPFSSSASYSTSIIGGSGYFDGSGDYLTIADNLNLRAGTSAFTVEAWIYRNDVGATHTIYAKGASTTGFTFFINSSNQLQFTYGTGSGNTNVTGTATIRSRVWVHVAAVRTSTSTNGFALYVNGVNDATNTISTDFNQTNEARVGTDRGLTNNFNGYISDLRFVKGSAVYTAGFTPPEAPLTAITNTQLLHNFTNAAIFDNAMMQVAETVGNAQISTTIKRFGTGSISFDGTGDWLLVPDTAENKLYSGTFTIELWVYLNATGAARGLVGKGTGTTGWLVSVSATNNVVFTYDASTITSTGTLAASTWYHIAVVREGTGTNQTKIYIGGLNDGTGTVATNFNQINSMYIGANRTGGDALNGYIDDLRITRDIARYTTNFTPPAAAFKDM